MLVRLTTLAGLGDDLRASDEERRRLAIARFGALVFVGDALLLFVATAFGHRGAVAGIALPGAAIVTPGRFLLGYRRLNNLVCQFVAALGTAILAAVVYFTIPAYGLLFVVSVCAVVFIFPLRWAIAQTFWMLVSFGIAVWFAHPQGLNPVEPMLLLSGTLAGILGIVVSLQRREMQVAEREREGNALLDAVFARSPLGVAIIDPNLRFARVNETYAGWSGALPDAHVDRCVDELQPGIAAQIEPTIRTLMATAEPVVGLETSYKGRHFRASHYPIRDAGGHITLIAAIVDDVTELKHAQERLAQLLAKEQAARLELEGIRRQLTARNAELATQATTDPLTKLANRAAFDERLTSALKRADRDGTAVGIAYIDLDGFKEINDRYGHEAGDHLLAAVAGRLTTQRRPNDVIARVGGDEFLLLLSDLEPHCARETLAAIATRIRGAIAAPFALERHGLVGIASSVGTSVYPDDARTAAELVAAADGAMYRRKRAA